jgi:hypothetical protein
MTNGVLLVIDDDLETPAGASAPALIGLRREQLEDA